MIRAAALVVLVGCGGAHRPPRARAPAAPASTETAETAPPATLEERLQAVHARSGRGRAPISEVARARLDAGTQRDYALTLRAGLCYAMIAVGDDGVTDLDLFLFDPGGFQIEWDRGRDPTPVVRHCTSVDGPYVLRVKMFGGAGEYALRVFGERARRAGEATGPPVSLPLTESSP